jgi:hypothetical protein
MSQKSKLQDLSANESPTGCGKKCPLRDGLDATHGAAGSAASWGQDSDELFAGTDRVLRPLAEALNLDVL